jgi:hypothetical protein
MDPIYWLIPILAAALVVLLILWKSKHRAGRSPDGKPLVYQGPIRYTDEQGRDMLIIRKEDGTFETVEDMRGK